MTSKTLLFVTAVLVLFSFGCNNNSNGITHTRVVPTSSHESYSKSLAEDTQNDIPCSENEYDIPCIDFDSIAVMGFYLFNMSKRNVRHLKKMADTTYWENYFNIKGNRYEYEKDGHLFELYIHNSDIDIGGFRCGMNVDSIGIFTPSMLDSFKKTYGKRFECKDYCYEIYVCDCKERYECLTIYVENDIVTYVVYRTPVDTD